MRVYNYKLNEGSLTITVDEAAGAISGICVEGNEVSLPEGCEEEAIAAMALAVDTTLNRNNNFETHRKPLERSGVPLQHR